MASRVRTLAWSAVVACLVAAGCSGSEPAHTTASGGANAASLESHSVIACTRDEDCAVCYHATGCGDAIAANDPAVPTPACHTTPAPFCMPRRPHCDTGHCAAR